MWPMTSFISSKIGFPKLTKKKNKSWCFYTTIFKITFQKSVVFICPSSFNVHIYYNYFVENCWKVSIITYPFETGLVIRARYRVFVNGWVNGVRNIGKKSFVPLNETNSCQNLTLVQQFWYILCIPVRWGIYLGKPESLCWSQHSNISSRKRTDLAVQSVAVC